MKLIISRLLVLAITFIKSVDVSPKETEEDLIKKIKADYDKKIAIDAGFEEVKFVHEDEVSMKPILGKFFKQIGANGYILDKDSKKLTENIKKLFESILENPYESEYGLSSNYIGEALENYKKSQEIAIAIILWRLADEKLRGGKTMKGNEILSFVGETFSDLQEWFERAGVENDSDYNIFDIDRIIRKAAEKAERDEKEREEKASKERLKILRERQAKKDAEEKIKKEEDEKAAEDTKKMEEAEKAAEEEKKREDAEKARKAAEEQKLKEEAKKASEEQKQRKETEKEAEEQKHREETEKAQKAAEEVKLKEEAEKAEKAAGKDPQSNGVLENNDSRTNGRNNEEEVNDKGKEKDKNWKKIFMIVGAILLVLATIFLSVYIYSMKN